MAKSFNELDVQHKWEEVTHTHVYKGYTLVHKIRLHGRRRKIMAESFNEPDVQHEREEITHTHVYKGYKHSTRWAMIHAQSEYKYGKYRYIPRAGHARISLNTVQEAQDCAMVQPQYELKHGPIGSRPVLAMLNHCTRGTRTELTVPYYTHIYEYKNR